MKKTPKFKSVPIGGKQKVSFREEQEQDRTREVKRGTKGDRHTGRMVAWLTWVQSCNTQVGSGLGINGLHWQFGEHQTSAKCPRSIWEVKWTSPDEQGTGRDADLPTPCQARTGTHTYVVLLGQGLETWWGWWEQFRPTNALRVRPENVTYWRHSDCFL